MKYDYLVFIGRFQPFHIGHEHVIKTALSLASKVIVLVGSSQQPRSVRNPWNYNERESFIRANFSDEENQNILAFPLLDYTYNEALWIKSIQQLVSAVVHTKIGSEVSIGLIGHQKDESSYYLSQFPQWQREECQNLKNISSTDIREMFFSTGEVTSLVSSTVSEKLKLFQTKQAYKDVKNECVFVKKYQEQWSDSPYPPMFITVDAVVVQSGHILLIQRRAEPGRGLMALPGGFLNAKETLKNAVIRELREETRIKVPAPVLQGSITKKEVFDNPYRSERGRTITYAYLIMLSGSELPKVKGGDDAAEAFWVPFAEINPELMFEDHYHIIQAMIA